MPSLAPVKSNNPFAPAPRKEVPFAENYHHSEDHWKQMVQITRVQLNKLMEQRAFFTLTSLVNKAVSEIRKQLPIKIGDDPLIDEHIEYILLQEDLRKIEESAYYTTGQMLKNEKIILAMVKDETNEHVIPEDVVEKAMDSLIKKNDQGETIEEMTEEQKRAVRVAALHPSRIAIIEGGPGTGKSHIMKAVNRAFTAMGYDVLGTAIAYTAAQNLAKSAGIKGNQTPLSLYVSYLEESVGNQGIDLFRKKTVLIVDESGMVDTVTMAKLLWYTKMNSCPVKIIVTGDSLQLNPVAAGNSLELMVDAAGSNAVRISKIRRQKQESHRAFVELLSQRVSGRALYLLEQQESLHWCENRTELRKKVVEDYLSYLYNNPGKTSMILTLVNDDVQAINAEVRKAYKSLGWITGDEISVNATDGNSAPKPTPFARGDQIVIRANDQNALIYERHENMSKNPDDWKILEGAQGVSNRYTGVVADILRNKKGERELVIHLYGEDAGTWAGVVILNTSTFKSKEPRAKGGFPVVHNFAMTVHASQGQTIDQIFMMNSDRYDSRLGLVAASRHRDGCDVYLDMTEIAASIDKKNRNKKKPKDIIQKEKSLKYGQESPEINVTTDRYPRSEMLRHVAYIWQRENVNQTVHMLIKDLRYGKQNINTQHLLKLTWDAVNKETNKPIPILDFCAARLEKRKPVVDVRTLLDRDEVKDSSIVGATKIERNNLGDTSDMELVDIVTKKPISPFASKRNFDDLDVDNPIGRASVEERKILLKAPENILQSNPVVKEIPFIEKIDKGLGFIDEKGILIFDNDDSTVKNSQIDTNLIKHLKHSFWDIGRYSEPRILARDGDDTVMSRYRIDGTCVAGDGYPPMLLSEHGDEKSNIIIVPGVKEGLLALQSFSEKYKDDKAKIPHIIWAAQDCDWKPLVEFLQSHEGKIIIIRSKIDERQIDWAQQLNHLMRNVYKIDVSVQPEIPLNHKVQKTNKIKR